MAEMYMSAKNAVIGWTMGITHHLHGVENVQMIANLALLRGMIGRPHAGLMPIRGHSNVQGMGSVGVDAAAQAGDPGAVRAAPRHSRPDVARPRHDGLHRSVRPRRDATRRSASAATCSAAIPMRRLPARRSASSNLIAYLSTSLNTGHAWGTAKETLILPVLPRDEEPQPTTQESMFSYVRLSDGGRARHHGPRSEVSVLAALGRGVLGDDGPVNWSDLESHERIRALIADLIPGLEPMADIDRTAQRVPHRRPPARHAAVSDRIRQGQVPCDRGCRRSPAPRRRQLRLMTVRSEGQFNTVVYEDEDIYRGQDRRDVILINPDDIAALRADARSAGDGPQPGRRAARPARAAVRRPRRAMR